MSGIKDYIFYNIQEAIGGWDLVAWRETFRDQQYKWLYDRIRPGTTLFDIGAGVGDTAIYFAMHPNVREVWSYEADNLQWYKLQFILSHAGFGNKIRTYHKKVYEIDYNLSKAKSPVAIKCDVEGDEYNIFNKDVNLKKVYAIVMEYHYKPEKLVRRLRRKHFKVRYTKPRKFKDMDVGFMYAWKR